MAYRIEGKDIVISGFEQGIADTPYLGIADMRNIDIINVPGEAMVGFATTAVGTPPVRTASAYTAQNTGDTITISSTTGFYAGVAIVLAANTAGGLSNSIVYYVGNIVGNTFQVWLNPTLNGSAVVVSSDGTGTLTTYQYGDQRATAGTYAPVGYYSFTGSTISPTINPGVFLTDASNYAWFIPSAGTQANNLLFLGNIGGAGAGTGGTASIAFWEGYILITGPGGTIDIAAATSLFATNGPAIAWTYAWQTLSTIQEPAKLLVSQEDSNLYFTTDTGLGSLIEQPGATFAPGTPATYSITATALSIPENDSVLSIAELGSSVYIGGSLQYIYVWDKLSLGFNQILIVPDAGMSVMVAANQSLFIFAGNQGRIYISNGSSVELYKKIPVYLANDIFGGINASAPTRYIEFLSGSQGRGQLYFSFISRTNAGVLDGQSAGVWAIDLSTKALRLINKSDDSIASGDYTGQTRMVVPQPYVSFSNVPAGNGLLISHNNDTFTSYQLKRGSSSPYIGGESYFMTDMIPVGTILKPLTPSQIEWKMSVPLGYSTGTENISVYYRTEFVTAFTLVGTSAGTSSVVTGHSSVSDLYTANFQKAQWVQFKVILSSTVDNPSYCRITELRVRDWPSQ